MERKEVIDAFLKSDIFNKWHFFKYHFNFYNGGLEHHLAKSIVDAVLDIENTIPEAGLDYLEKIACINDKPDETKHYDQLMQVLAELLVVHKAVTFDWGENTKLTYEPTAPGSAKNPELMITSEDVAILLEVKAPEFSKKHNERAEKSQQIPSRSQILQTVNVADTMLPRDNPVKDFLISANAKFEGFKKENPDFYSVLVIVWDDFIYEPISALTSPQAGLFTENSFAKDEQGNRLTFPFVDCVIITRHLLLIKQGTRNEPLADVAQHPLDYGRHGEFPFKVYIKNPESSLELPDKVIDCFQVLQPGPQLGAEYLPIDLINWF